LILPRFNNGVETGLKHRAPDPVYRKNRDYIMIRASLTKRPGDVF